MQPLGTCVKCRACKKKQIKLDVDKEKKGDREMVRYEGLHWKIVQGQENEEKCKK